MIIRVISRRWKKMLKEFRREEAMEDDREFEKLIIVLIKEYAPMLRTLLKDRKLYLIHEETQASARGIPESSRLFNRDELLPLRVLLLLKRRQLLSDVKLMMPFWYSLPIISQLVAFFAGLGKKKKLQAKQETPDEEREEDPLAALRSSAEEVEARLVPRGRSLDSYLDELVSRWGRLVNKQARDNLVEDVNSLLRDKLRQMIRLQKNAVVNRNTLDKMTGSIMDSSPGLQKIGEQNALTLYIKLYLVKLLKSKVIM